MNSIPKPMPIEPAFADREAIRAMFALHAPYRAIASYAPEGVGEKQPILPWFRGDWALNGKPLVEGADRILHNEHFLEAARDVFGVSRVYPEFVAVNINGPMPAGTTHVDNPSFYGATRVDYPLPLLRVMGNSGLFESWRVTRASTLSWFYDGPGGNFDYWPEGLEGPLISERAPFGNQALCVDTDRTYHRIGPIGDGQPELPKMSAAAEIRPDGEDNWAILENGEVRATYPSREIRFSVLWKAEVRTKESAPGSLTLDCIMSTFIADLRCRGLAFPVPSNPASDSEWILLLQRVYAPPASRPEASSIEAPTGVSSR